MSHNNDTDPSGWSDEQLEEHARIWMPIPGHEGKYEVSRFGQVRSVDHTVMRSNGCPQRVKGRILKPHFKRTYHAVHLQTDLGAVSAFVAHLVLKAFVGPRPPNHYCCHNDGNPLNNNLTNLRWDTQSANMRDTVIHGTHREAAKTRCKHGHYFDEENTYIRPARGGRARDCRQCTRNRGRKYRQKNAEAMRLDAAS